jgi:hypothetical protein
MLTALLADGSASRKQSSIRLRNSHGGWLLSLFHASGRAKNGANLGEKRKGTFIQMSLYSESQMTLPKERATTTRSREA